MAPTSSTRGADQATISEITSFLQVSSRLTNALQGLAVFNQSGVGFTEWMFLRQMTEDSKLKAVGLAGKLGVTPQRAAQVITGLRKGGYVKATPGTVDTRQNDLSITAKGQTLLAELDNAVSDFFADAIAERPKALAVGISFGRALIKKNSTAKSAG